MIDGLVKMIGRKIRAIMINNVQKPHQTIMLILGLEL